MGLNKAMDNQRKTLENFGVPLGKKGTGGLIAPLLAFKFRVVANDDLELIQHFESIEADFAQRTLTMVIRECCDGRNFDKIIDLIANPFSVRWEPMSGSGDDPVKVLTFDCVRVHEHHAAQDYKDSNGYVAHRLVCSYRSVSTK